MKGANDRAEKGETLIEILLHPSISIPSSYLIIHPITPPPNNRTRHPHIGFSHSNLHRDGVFSRYLRALTSILEGGNLSATHFFPSQKSAQGTETTISGLWLFMGGEGGVGGRDDEMGAWRSSFSDGERVGI